jgi:DNA primase
MNLRLMIAAAATAAMLYSCQRGNESKQKNDLTLSQITKDESSPGVGLTGNERQNEKEESPGTPSPSPGQKQPIPNYREPAPVPADWDKQIIKNAELQLWVSNPAAVSKSAKEALRLAGGYIGSATETRMSEGQTKVDMTLRVPREKFDELVDKLTGYGDSIIQKDISAQDVTEEFVDTKARILAKEKARDRYYEFIKQARNVKEVMEIEREIKDLQEEIEAASGRINYLQHQSTLSTIHLVFFEPVIPNTTPQEEPVFLQQLKYGIIEGWSMIQALVLVLVKIWPLWLAGFIIWGVIRSRKTKSALPAQLKS